MNLTECALQYRASTTVEGCQAGGGGLGHLLQYCICVSTMPKAQNRTGEVQLSSKTKHFAHLAILFIYGLGIKQQLIWKNTLLLSWYCPYKSLKHILNYFHPFLLTGNNNVLCTDYTYILCTQCTCVLCKQCGGRSPPPRGRGGRLKIGINVFSQWKHFPRNIAIRNVAYTALLLDRNKTTELH